MILKADDSSDRSIDSRPDRKGSIAQAHRARRARRIIRDAYRARPNASRLRVIRYYLIGDVVAAALVADEREPQRVGSVLVAMHRVGRRAVRLRDDSVATIGGWRELVAHIEQLHAKYGEPIARRASSLHPAPGAR
jgi:hypothetical protein